MAVVPVCYKLYYKDQTLSVPKGSGKNEGYCRSSATVYIKSKTYTQNMVHTDMTNLQSSSDGASGRECAVEFSSTKKQLRSLNYYFRKLHKNVGQPSPNSLNNRAELLGKAEKGLASLNDYLDKLNNGSVTLLSQSKAKKGLEFLDDYLGKGNKEANSKSHVASASDTETTEVMGHSFEQGFRKGGRKLKIYMGLENRGGSESSYDETSSLYLMGILVSINIAVFLFELATPVRNSELELFSLPLLYGAKINHLILIGEWWRLVTPMFLHLGIHHIALGCWMLFTFGPPVCRAYGSFTFIMIYILGGLYGNLTSFLHTPDPTVGGTGPVFAIIGAWLISQILNRDTLGEADSESMLRKAMIATAVSCILSNFGPIDDWTHYGAAFTGIVYGFLTCPILQMNDAASKNGEEEGITLVRRYVDPCKSFLFFSLFILVLGSLVFVVEPPLNSLAVDIFV